MRRADRLFDIVQALRGDRLVTAQALADKLEVSVRTIYRDIRDLQAGGVPIDGEAGMGYILRPGFDLPPLMFTLAEIEALVVGARMVRAWTGTALAGAAAEALVKIGAVVPPDRLRTAEKVAVYSPGFILGEDVRARFDLAMAAIARQRRLRLAYVREDGGASDRVVRPLALHFWGGVWTLAVWCELRSDFRSFRLDRMLALSETGDGFVAEAGKGLDDFMAQVRRESGG